MWVVVAGKAGIWTVADPQGLPPVHLWTIQPNDDSPGRADRGTHQCAPSHGEPGWDRGVRGEGGRAPGGQCHHGHLRGKGKVLLLVWVLRPNVPNKCVLMVGARHIWLDHTCVCCVCVHCYIFWILCRHRNMHVFPFIINYMFDQLLDQAFTCTAQPHCR